jgi:putative transcriptional regulator
MCVADATTKTAKHNWKRLDAMTDAEVHEGAVRDPDARPISDEEFARARRVPRVRTIRRALGLTQEEFATRFPVPLGTLRDWEQGRAEPDQTGARICERSPGTHPSCFMP